MTSPVPSSLLESTRLVARTAAKATAGDGVDVADSGSGGGSDSPEVAPGQVR